jgi:hypothetical protein
MIQKSAGLTPPNWAPTDAVKTPILGTAAGNCRDFHRVMYRGKGIINSPKASAAQKAVNHFTTEHHA